MQAAIGVAPVGPHPTHFTCPSCGAAIVSKTELIASNKTHIIALLLCLVCFPLACIPYCADSCKDVTHYCPSCNAYLGRYKN